MIKHYAEFYFPGSFVSETTAVEVPNRTDRPKLSTSCYAWRFFDRSVVEQEGETLMGKPKNYSPTYYLGEEFTAEEFIKSSHCNSIARDNIIGNKYKRVVRTIHGQIFPIDEEDVVISQ